MVATPGRSGQNLRSQSGDPFPPDSGPGIPEKLTDAEAEKWAQLVSQLPQTALRRIDAHQLRILACLLARFDEYACQPAKNLQVGRLLVATAAHIHRLSAAFGLTPADRSRMNLPATEAVDDISEWLKEG